MKTQLHDERIRTDITKGMKLLGDSWTLLILGDLMGGERRFNELQNSLNVAPSVLTNRLNRLIDTKMVVKETKLVNKLSVTYRLTPRGKDMDKVLHALSAFIKKNFI